MKSLQKTVRTCFYCKRRDFLNKFYKHEGYYSQTCLDCHKEGSISTGMADDFMNVILGVKPHAYYYEIDRDILMELGFDNNNYAKAWFVRRRGRNRYNVFNTKGDFIISYFKYEKNRIKIIK